eukprot:scaffold54074_cov60-Phaeocystis_antarctica.AAC.3
MGNGERVGVSMGVDGKTNTRGGGAPQRGHGAPLQRLTQLSDALRGVGALAVLAQATELVVGQAANGEEECQWAVSAVPVVIEAAELVGAQAANGEEVVSMGADTKANIGEPVRATGGLLELFQRQVALQPVSKRGSCLGAEVVVSQTASTGAERVLRRVKGR